MGQQQSVPSFRAFRAPILHFTSRPDPERGSGYEYFPDGVLVVRDGYVVTLGSATELSEQGMSLAQCEHHPDKLLLPGLIDPHIHYPQTGIIASYGEQLIDWLNHYTFPAEQAFQDPGFAEAKASEFLDLLLESGTTTAMVYTTPFAQSTEAFFEAALARNLRMIAGKVMMDRNAPEGLCDSVTSGVADTRRLIERWHGRGRLNYAVTPRFAPTSSREQLAAAGSLLREYEGVYLQTHLSENTGEVGWVRSLFPEARDYLDVYDGYGLLGPRSVFGHGIHLSTRERQRMADTGSRIAFCPTSNLFLGSGLFDLASAEDAGIEVGVATDVGGGTSFSILATLAEGYKVLQLQGQSLHPLVSLYMATLGNARALGLADCIGNLEPGKEADFILVDPGVSRVQQQRQDRAQGLEEVLFALMMLGDERNIAATYVQGVPRFQRDRTNREVA
ncbi:guanine deaminase [Halomonadaceae bacterium KBTZ08]